MYTELIFGLFGCKPVYNTKITFLCILHSAPEFTENNHSTIEATKTTAYCIDNYQRNILSHL